MIMFSKEDVEKLVGELPYKLFINFYTSSYKVGDCANTRECSLLYDRFS